MCNTFFEIFAKSVLKCVPAAGNFGEKSGAGAIFGDFGADRQVFPPSGALLRDFGAEQQVFPPSGADFGIFGADFSLFAKMKPDHPSQNGL